MRRDWQGKEALVVKFSALLDVVDPSLSIALASSEVDMPILWVPLSVWTQPYSYPRSTKREQIHSSCNQSLGKLLARFLNFIT